MERVRPATLAGTWYPGRSRELAAAVRGYLEDDSPDAAAELAPFLPPVVRGTAGGAADAPAAPAPAAPAPPASAARPVLAVAPHAGYAYSGPTAGRIYRRLAPWRYDRVFILAPSHRYRLSVVSVAGCAAYATPLGEAAVDQDVAGALAEAPGFSSVSAAHAAEHAEEIQLPFLQTLYGDGLRIVPLLVPRLTEAARAAAAAALAPFADGRSLFLVSSDFTHYGSAYGYVPFRDRIPARLAELDGGAIARILARDPLGLLAYEQRTGITMCGIDAAALALSVPLPVGEGELVAYARSGDREGDYSLSVSYAGLLLAQADPAASAAGAEPAGAAASGTAGAGAAGTRDGAAPLTDDERKLLLALARAVIEATAAGRASPAPAQFAAELGLPLTPALRQKRGAFVTLTSGGRLRGCIGTIEGIQPLAAAVADNAAAAASRDPRFHPVAVAELPRLRIEISALTALRPVADASEIEIGRHGIVLAKGRARAVFLPQVAPEQGWNRETTLDHLAMKAGLPPDAWRVGARFQVFEAEVFAEAGGPGR